MTWVQEARRAWDEHQERERDAAARDAAHVIEHVERMRDRLGARPAPGTARLAEQEHAVVEDGMVRLACTTGNGGAELPSGVRAIELRADADDRGQLPEVHAWLRLAPMVPNERPRWIDRGRVETLADLGRALDPTVTDVQAPGEEPEQSVGDMLLTVLQGLVREVVHQEFDGRLGSGKT